MGTWYVTNALNDSVEDIYFTNINLGTEFLCFDVKNKHFRVSNNGECYIKYAKMSSNKMKLYNKQKNCLCNIVLSDTADIFLENNTTPYELIIYESFIGIYDRDYISSLTGEEPDANKLIADIEWDIIDSKSNLGIAKLNIYVPNQDIDMFLLLASSTFLLFHKYVKAQQRVELSRNLLLWWYLDGMKRYMYKNMHR